MNTRQKIVLWIAVIGGVAIGMFPPWHSRRFNVTFSEGYAFILNPPSDIAAIDATRFAVQFCTLTFLTVALTLALRSRESGKRDATRPP